MAARTTLLARDLPDNLHGLRTAIEQAVPMVERLDVGIKGAWATPPSEVDAMWGELLPGFERILEKYPRLKQTNNHVHPGTLGTGNHFIEICLDERQQVWLMLHSGSRGVGNAIGTLFIELA